MEKQNLTKEITNPTLARTKSMRRNAINLLRKCLHSKKLAEREGFEPSIELLDPITV
jgi:hypothetical protein